MKESHGYTKSTDEYIAERTKVLLAQRQPGQYYFCVGGDLRGLPNQSHMWRGQFERCDYESFSKLQFFKYKP